MDIQLAKAPGQETYQPETGSDDTVNIEMLAQFLSREVGLDEENVLALTEALRLPSPHHVQLREVLGGKEFHGGGDPWEAFDGTTSIGTLYRRLLDLGERATLSLIIKNAPASSDKLGEHILKLSYEGLLAEVQSLIGRNERYDSLVRMYEQALKASSFLCEQLAPFSSQVEPHHTPDYGLYLTRGALMPIVNLGSGLPSLLGKRAARTLGRVIDYVKEYDTPSGLRALGFSGLESKELECMTQVVDLAYALNQKPERIVPPVTLQTSTLPAVESPCGFVEIGEGYMNRSDRLQVTSAPIHSVAVARKGIIVLSENGVWLHRNPPVKWSEQNPACLMPRNGRSEGRSYDALPYKGALSPSGRHAVGLKTYGWMTEEACSKAQREEASFELVRFTDDFSGANYRSFEPLEGVYGRYASEKVLPNFTWQHRDGEEYVATCAANMPRCYLGILAQNGDRRTEKFDLRHFEYEHVQRESANRFIAAKLDPHARFLVALVAVPSGTIVTVFDRSEYRDDPLLPVFDQYLSDAVQKQPVDLEVSNDGAAILFDAEQHPILRLEAKTDSFGFPKWKITAIPDKPRELRTGVRVVSPDGGCIAAVDGAGKSVQFFDWNTLEAVHTIRFALTPDETLTSIQYSSNATHLLFGDSRGGVWREPVGMLVR